MTQELDIELLRRVLQAWSRPAPLRLALLFGSAARGQLRADSDVDLGILPGDSAMSLNEELELQGALEKAMGRDVDLIRLDRANTLLRFRIAKEHVPLLAQPRHELPRFLARAAIEHADMEPNLSRGRVLLARRLAEGVTAEASRGSPT